MAQSGNSESVIEKEATDSDAEKKAFDQSEANAAYRAMLRNMLDRDGKARPLLHYVRLGLSSKVNLTEVGALQAGLRAVNASPDSAKTIIDDYLLCADATKQTAVKIGSESVGFVQIYSVARAVAVLLSGKLPSAKVKDVDRLIYDSVVG